MQLDDNEILRYETVRICWGNMYCRSLWTVYMKMQMYHTLFNSQINYCHLAWVKRINVMLTNFRFSKKTKKKNLRIMAKVRHDTRTESFFFFFELQRHENRLCIQVPLAIFLFIFNW